MLLCGITGMGECCRKESRRASVAEYKSQERAGSHTQPKNSSQQLQVLYATPGNWTSMPRIWADCHSLHAVEGACGEFDLAKAVGNRQPAERSHGGYGMGGEVVRKVALEKAQPSRDSDWPRTLGEFVSPASSLDGPKAATACPMSLPWVPTHEWSYDAWHCGCRPRSRRRGRQSHVRVAIRASWNVQLTGGSTTVSGNP